MVRKNNKNKNKIKNIEKYTFALLVSGYFTGICIGAYFVFGNAVNTEFANTVSQQNDLNVLAFFIFALILKYSGILSGAMCTLPLFLGIHNSAYYCNYIIYSENKLIYTTILDMFKDTAVCILLILYIVIITVQISSQKYILKKDLKYITAYLSGAAAVYALEYILKSFIFRFY